MTFIALYCGFVGAGLWILLRAHKIREEAYKELGDSEIPKDFDPDLEGVPLPDGEGL